MVDKIRSMTQSLTNFSPNRNTEKDKQLEFEDIKMNITLGLQCLPQFGIYGYEYQWLYITAAFRREFASSLDFSTIKEQLPSNVKSILQDGVENNNIQRPSQVHYYIMNLNARALKQQMLIDRNQQKIRLNFAPHAYIWQNARQGQETKINALTAIFTSYKGKMIHSTFRGIDECKDFGRISINPSTFFKSGNSQEVHIHPSDDDNMAISPNNGTFLLNLGFPVVNFHVVLYTLNDQQLSIFKAEIEKNEKRKMIPGLYVKVLEKSIIPIQNSIENTFSYYLQAYESSEEKENHLKRLFAEIFCEKKIEDSELSPEIGLVAEDYLELFYKYIWWKMKSPEIEKFGQKFFFQLCSISAQLNLLVKYMEVLKHLTDEIYLQHLGVLQKFIPVDMNIDMIELEEQKIQFQDQVMNADEEEKELMVIQKPQLLINCQDEVEDTPKDNFFIKNLPKNTEMPESAAFQSHLEALFSGDRQLIKNSFNKLSKILQDYICFETWQSKGSIHGIHNDFGRHSYLQSPDIGEYYHLNDEERINFILQLQDQLSNL
ncbi:UNKNOWN [Stylonychia lemnae]|uniref:Uncharacterized protein n=1 Tax=Stylonychia lemnae TaxID=5949 RepID=A0A078A711_STYLE|nr:UNKNOWN [Stylonychia lemnae]|eukprot:CDW76566.1 UNKNOWN [Stylonychia lemnae]